MSVPQSAPARKQAPPPSPAIAAPDPFMPTLAMSPVAQRLLAVALAVDAVNDEVRDIADYASDDLAVRELEDVRENLREVYRVLWNEGGNAAACAGYAKTKAKAAAAIERKKAEKAEGGDE